MFCVGLLYGRMYIGTIIFSVGTVLINNNFHILKLYNYATTAVNTTILKSVYPSQSCFVGNDLRYYVDKIIVGKRGRKWNDALI